MSLDQKHLKLVAHGGYNDTHIEGETWACSINLFGDQSVPSDEDLLPTTGDYRAQNNVLVADGYHIQSEWDWHYLGGDVVNPIDYLDQQAGPAWAAFMGATNISSKVILEGLSLYPMQGNGLAFYSRVATLSYDTPVPGGRSGDMLPPENSVVVSWRTGRPGPRGRGRIYPPASTTSGVSSYGEVDGSMQGDLRDAAVTLLEGLGVNLGDGDVNVRPIVTGDPWTTYAVITRCDVGNVVDTQRRRRRQLVETRLSGTPSY